MKFRHHMELVLQQRACVKDSQKPLKDLLAMHQRQDIGLGNFSTFLVTEINSAVH